MSTPHGLDGNGTTSAADLPASVWSWTQHPAVTDTLSDEQTAIRRTRCLVLSDDRVMPQQCADHIGHVGLHSWQREPEPILMERRRLELQAETNAEDIAGVPESVWQDDGGTGGHDEDERAAEGGFRRRVLGRWSA